jgi:prephenate dehydrogenase
MAVLFQNALILGLGVIGGSVAAGIKKHGLANSVTGYALMDDANAAFEVGAVDIAINSADDLPLAVSKADLVVLALPVHLCIALLPTLESHLCADAVLTDVCSVKKPIADAVAATLGLKAGQFVPAHPIAGSHLSGFEGASASLFAGASVVVAPCANEDAFNKICTMWRALGAELEVMNNELHDEHYAAVSHLPHAVAFALANTVLSLTQTQPGEASERLSSLVGKGFLDTTRIAASSAELWAGISMANRDALMVSLDEFIAQITKVRQALNQGNSAALQATFERAGEFRRSFDSK